MDGHNNVMVVVYYRGGRKTGFHCSCNIVVCIIYRYYMIQRAKDAQVVGIVVGTLGVGN